MAPDTRHTSRDIWLKHAQARDALGKVLPAMRACGLTPVLVKGVALEATLYNDSARRAISDVDLRIPSSQFAAVRALAAREGWRIDSCYEAYGSLCVEVEGIPIDIESHIGPPGLCRLRVEDLLAHGQRVAVGSQTVVVPDVHDHALVVVINLFKDKVSTAMPWSLGDLAELVKSPAFRKDVFFERAQRYRMSLMCKVVLQSARISTPELQQLSREMKAPAWYPLYVRAYERAAKAPHGHAARVIARLGSDEPGDWPRALFLALRLTVER